MSRLLLVGAVLGVVACRGPDAPTTGPARGVPPTTSGAIADRNLDGEIAVLTRLAADARSGATEPALVLVDRLLRRTAARRWYRDLEHLEAWTDVLVARHPDSAAAHLARARYRAAVHDFDGAGRDLARAAARGAEDRHARAAILLADQPGGATLQALAASFEADTSFRGRATAAAIATARGDWDAADRSWQQALAGYRGVSPHDVAWVEFQRGVLWAEAAGHVDRGALHYREAVRVLPGHVPAQLHLAEIEAASGDAAAAIVRLRPLVDASDDHEAPALLARLLRDRAPEEAAILADLAHRRYHRWSARFPAALAHHPLALR